MSGLHLKDADASNRLASLFADVTGGDFLENVTVEHNADRGVLYVHVNGITILRICRAKGKVSYMRKGRP